MSTKTVEELEQAAEAAYDEMEAAQKETRRVRGLLDVGDDGYRQQAIRTSAEWRAMRDAADKALDLATAKLKEANERFFAAARAARVARAAK
jgi:hypothetical protein